ncbi:acyl carrier protein [Neorhizobium alkalisoli]|uniref:acyl carrier protein n=1 Tax=Neorhizobium alkalisoli TaxID=528178 RepID=UPI00119E1E5B|nr:acyl carrier protein [Neorhizobium alkalisoli]
MVVFNDLRRLIADFFGVEAEDITAESTANDIDGWDSIGHTMLIIEIERTFGVSLEGHDTQALDNVGGLLALILQQKATSGGVARS